MSDTSVLLPSSEITVFSTEDNTREVSESLANDWRYARVKVNSINGGVEEAITHYQTNSSPDLLIIQTDIIDDGFTEKLAELASNCAEGTDAVIIGPDNDVQLYRKLISMGISDYIVRPIENPVFSDVIAKTLIDKLGVTGSRLIVALGSRGGSGVSTLMQGLATGLSEIYQQKNLLIDAAGGWSTNTVGLGLEPTTTLKEAVKVAMKNDHDGVKRMILKVNDKLGILASGGDIMLEPTINKDGLEKLLNMVLKSYPIVIFDASATPPELQKAALMMAHKILLFSSPGLFSLRMTRTLLNELKDIRDVSEEGVNKDLISLILNFKDMQGKKDLAIKEMEGMLDQKVEGTIAFDPDLFTSIEAEGKKLSEDSKGRDILETMIKTLHKVVPDLAGGVKEETKNSGASGLGGILKKLTGKKP